LTLRKNTHYSIVHVIKVSSHQEEPSTLQNSGTEPKQNRNKEECPDFDMKCAFAG